MSVPMPDDNADADKKADDDDDDNVCADDGGRIEEGRKMIRMVVRRRVSTY